MKPPQLKRSLRPNLNFGKSMTSLLLHADHVLTMDANNTVLNNAAVIVDTNGRITDVGDAKSLVDRY